MILDLFFGVLLGFLTWLINLLPVSSLGLSSIIGQSTTQLGVKLGPIDNLVPLHELLTMATIFAVTWLPAAGAYMLANWVWRHIPTAGG